MEALNRSIREEVLLEVLGCPFVAITCYQEISLHLGFLVSLTKDLTINSKGILKAIY